MQVRKGERQEQTQNDGFPEKENTLLDCSFPCVKSTFFPPRWADSSEMQAILFLSLHLQLQKSEQLAEGNFFFPSPPQKPLQVLTMDNITPIRAPHWRGHKEPFPFMLSAAVLTTYDTRKRNFGGLQSATLILSIFFAPGPLRRLLWAEQQITSFIGPAASSYSHQIHTKAPESWSNSAPQTPYYPHL